MYIRFQLDRQLYMYNKNYGWLWAWNALFHINANKIETRIIVQNFMNIFRLFVTHLLDLVSAYWQHYLPYKRIHWFLLFLFRALSYIFLSHSHSHSHFHYAAFWTSVCIESAMNTISHWNKWISANANTKLFIQRKNIIFFQQ